MTWTAEWWRKQRALDACRAAWSLRTLAFRERALMLEVCVSRVHMQARAGGMFCLQHRYGRKTWVPCFGVPCACPRMRTLTLPARGHCWRSNKELNFSPHTLPM